MLHYLESEYPQGLFRIVVWKEEEEEEEEEEEIRVIYDAYRNLCITTNILIGRRERIPIVNIFILNLESKLQNDEGYAYSSY